MSDIKPELKEAIARYKKFHAKTPDKTKSIDIPYPKVLVYLGEGLAIEYRSAKIAKGVPEGSNNYRHRFKSGVKVYTDPDGKMLYLCGGKFRVTDWMRD